MRRVAILGLAAGMVLGPGDTAIGARRRATLQCREFVAGGLRDLIHVGLARLEACHEARHRTRATCNSLAGALDFQRAQYRAQGIVNAFCLKGNPILENYPILPGSDLVTVVTPVIRRRLESSGETLQAANVSLAGGVRRCSRAIGRARTAIVDRIVGAGVKCQTQRDRRSRVLGAVASACVGAPPGVVARGAASIARACLGLSGFDIGSCGPLPECVLASAIGTGQALVRDIYGSLPSERTSLCGNGVIEVGEQCDDGNRDNNDACTNACANAKCGDGIVETGVEECDDANNIETDACTPLCKLARCGDGILETEPPGIEECDDGTSNGTPLDPCDASCKFVQVACSAAASIQANLTLVPAKDGSSVPFGGMEIDLEYPSGLVIPGSGALDVGDPTDPATRVALDPLVSPSPYNGGLLFFNDTDTVLQTTFVLPSGEIMLGAPLKNFERARFDCTPGTLFSAAQLTCTVPDESDRLGGKIPQSKRPTCRVLLTQ